jgi:hypothetical protein
MNECVVAPIWLQALRPAQEHAGAGIVAEDLDLPGTPPGRELDPPQRFLAMAADPPTYRNTGDLDVVGFRQQGA